MTLRVDGDVGILSGADDLATGAEAPDTRLWHYNGGVEFELTEPNRSPWEVTANLAAGATTFSGDDFAQPLTNPVTEETVTDFSETYFTANGGLKVGYDVGQNVNVLVVPGLRGRGRHGRLQRPEPVGDRGLRHGFGDPDRRGAEGAVLGTLQA